MTRGTVARNTGIITIGLGADKLVGVLKTVLVAALFGLSRDLDAMLAALALPMAASIIGSESLSTAALNVIVRHRARGREREGWRALSALTNTIALVAVAGTALYAIAAPQVVRTVAPGLDPATAARAVLLTRVLAPLVPLQFALGIAQGALHAHGRFWLPAARLAVSNAVAVIVLAWLHPRLGITAYALGFLAGDGVAVIAHLPALARVGWRWQPVLDLSCPEVRRALAFSAPMLGGAIILQVMMILEKTFASTLAAGSISCLDYGIRLLVLFYVFERALTNALFPHLAQRFAESSLERFRHLVAAGVRAHLLVALPVTVGALLLREPLIRLLLQRGAFDARATTLTSWVAALYLFGLLGMSLRHFLAQVYHATGDSRTPMIAAAASLAIYIAGARLLLPALGAGALALALSLAMSANAALMMAALARATHGLSWRPLALFTAKAVMASLVVGALLWAGRDRAGALEGRWALLLLPGAAAAGAAVYTCVLACLRTEEALEIGRIGRQLLRRAQ
jgi:putative peptidoglycan lipid II flippase